MKRVAVASYVGSAIEYYDFYVYGTAAALVFPRVFFPHLSTTMATVASMATLAAAFVSRPAGAAFFGHFGDRLGRKATLTATLLIMGLSTVAVGLVPGAATIGVAAPVLLLALRLAQGFAVGGEWAGAALLATEHAPAEARGRYGMFTSLGAGSMVGFFAFGYIANAYLTGYAHTGLGFSPDLILGINVLGGVTAMTFCALAATACDRFGRRRVIVGAFAAGVPWAFVLFPLVDTGDTVWYTVAIVGTYAIAGAAYGPMGAFITETFATRYRYSGAGLALNIAGLVGGAIPPLIAAPLTATFGAVGIGTLLGVLVVTSLVSTYLLPETMGAALSTTHESS